MGFIAFPVIGNLITSKNYTFKQGLHAVYSRHLFKGNLRLLYSNKQPFVARHHFHPDVLLLNDKHEHGSYFITKIDAQLARMIGLREGDRVAGLDSYYAVPNQSLKDATDYVTGKETDLVVTGSSIVLKTRMSSGSKQEMRKIQAAFNVSATAEKERLIKLDKILSDDAITRASLSENQEELFQRSLQELQQKDNEIYRLKSDLSMLRLNSDELDRKLGEEIKKSEAITAKQKESGNSRNGLERGLILNSFWHESNPQACSHLLGFHTFEEYKVYCVCLFPGIKLEYGTCKLDNITDWEKLTMTKIRMRRGVSLFLLNLIFSRNRTTVGVYVTFGAAKWGEAGENLSILELTKEYLDHERPQIFTDANHQSVAALVDGKDFMTADPKQNSAIKKGMWSDKINHAGVRICSWSTPSGLTFEHTPAYMARATETAIVALWGSYWDYVPLGKVPNIRPVSLKFIKSEKYEEKCPVLKKIIKQNRSNGTGADDMNDEGENDEADLQFDDDEIGEANSALRGTPSINLTYRGSNFIDEVRKRALKTNSGRKYSTDDIAKMNSGLLKAGPNESSTRKLEQLIVHEALHKAYSSGVLRKCLLS